MSVEVLRSSVFYLGGCRSPQYRAYLRFYRSSHAAHSRRVFRQGEVVLDVCVEASGGNLRYSCSV